jgi:hypothetical protein
VEEEHHDTQLPRSRATRKTNKQKSQYERKKRLSKEHKPLSQGTKGVCLRNEEKTLLFSLAGGRSGCNVDRVVKALFFLTAKRVPAKRRGKQQWLRGRNKHCFCVLRTLVKYANVKERERFLRELTKNLVLMGVTPGECPFFLTR